MESLRRVVAVIAPGGRPVGVQRLQGSYSNDSYRIDVHRPDGQRDAIVTRRYAESSESPRAKAVREFKTLELLAGHREVPTPQPLLLDADGELLGSPGIVTAFVAGEIVAAHPESVRWARRCTTVAQMLARIHAVALDPSVRDFLMDAATEAVWFVGDGPPDYMRSHPDGTAVWQAVHDLRPHVTTVHPTLVHLDYWSGNLLWDRDQLVAVVDWEEASYGNPAIDVAYCVMELCLEGLDAAAADFVRAYEHAAGRRLVDLGYWKLAASARPMTDLDAWLTRPEMAQRLHRFITQALDDAREESGSIRRGGTMALKERPRRSSS